MAQLKLFSAPIMNNNISHDQFMPLALKYASEAASMDEVPVGAIIVKNNHIIAANHNRVISWHDPSAHAEILAIRDAAKHLSSEFLIDCDLYVTLEPCPMCAFAISLARIRRVYFGAYDAKMGGVEHGARIFQSSSCHHKPQVYGGIMEAECSHILKQFFMQKRLSSI